MVASSDLVHGAAKKVGASADDIDATNKKVDATVKELARRRKMKSERTK